MKTKILNFLFENLSPSPTIFYTITEKLNSVFCSAPVIEGPEAPEDPHW